MAMKQLNRLRKGVTEWNTWREQNREVYIDLSGANLSGANLSGANLSGADLNRADFNRADLSSADLSSADLSSATLYSATLNSANLNSANLNRADLSYADLSYATLYSATLYSATLSGANLNRADLSGARTFQTIFNDIDLRSVKGLETIVHGGPSGITTSTLEHSQGDISDVFLKGAGLSDESISYARSFLHHPIQYYTCFLSYSSQDQDFAERLYADLQQKGIRCWFAPHSLKIGDHFPRRIEEAIRIYDKLLLILSHHSVQSEWVEDEVRAALEKEQRFRKEQQQERTVLFPLQIDSDIKDTSTQWAAKLRRTRHIGNFHSWKDHDAYKQAFDRLLRDLKADPKDIQGNMP